ncbi:MAG: carboxypeptidase regulatory-like domain-containing protein [Gemmatimonadota bacterium]
MIGPDTLVPILDWRGPMPYIPSRHVVARTVRRMRSRVCTVLSVGVLLGLPFSLAGGLRAEARPGGVEPQSIEGVLLDASDGTPLAQGVVRLLDTGGEVLVATLTDADGEFSLAAPSAGEYRLEASRLGYHTDERAITLEPGETLRLELRLEPDAMLLDPLVVTGERAAHPPRCAPLLVLGRVVAGSTGDGIPAAGVELLGGDGDPLATARTDAEGDFMLVTPGPGMYWLRGEAEGYAPATGAELPLLPGDTVEVRFRLDRDGAPPTPMEVTASARPWSDRDAIVGRGQFFARMADCQGEVPDGSRFAEFLDRSVIEAYVEEGWPVERMLDREVRSVWNVTAGGSVQLFGGCWPVVYVDGTQSYEPRPLSRYGPGELEAVEVHRSPHVPQRYWPQGIQPCGAVAIWTRRTPESVLASGSSVSPVRVLFMVGAVLLGAHQLFR